MSKPITLHTITFELDEIHEVQNAAGGNIIIKAGPSFRETDTYHITFPTNWESTSVLAKLANRLAQENQEKLAYLRRVDDIVDKLQKKVASLSTELSWIKQPEEMGR